MQAITEEFLSLPKPFTLKNKIINESQSLPNGKANQKITAVREIMLFKSNTSNSSFSELTAQLRDFTSRKNQDFKTKLSNSKFLEKSRNFLKRVYTNTFKRSKFKYEGLAEMKISDTEFLKIMETRPDIYNVIRGIVLARSQVGASMEEIRGKFLVVHVFLVKNELVNSLSSRLLRVRGRNFSTHGQSN